MAFVTGSGGLGRVHRRGRSEVDRRVVVRMQTPGPRELAKALCGHWWNREQAVNNASDWSNIHQFHVPIEDGIVNGVGILSESYYDWNFANLEPYLTVVQGLTQHEDGYIVARKYMIEKPIKFRGGTREPERMECLKPDSVLQPESDEDLKCALHWTYDAETDVWKGVTCPGKECKVVRGGVETYVDGSYELGKEQFLSLDVGRSLEADIIVWGSGAGPFDFRKVESFASLVPELDPVAP
ncbi:hypothetical protein NDN08_004607 [Rhodosorus marinus]|uniref:Uncharacterized protein n=1 Tax=Rhodosorus marinus TaxID=101924 RepID=A0AAV8ULT2_9RHOD|nr:hypothetical protein NDN08_004607 [Rhodosorus marinus]